MKLLTAKAVEKLHHDGPLHFRDVKDGGAPGLYLRLSKSGKKAWVMRYKFDFLRLRHFREIPLTL